VAKTVYDKMIRRHTHVLGGVTYDSEEERQKAWEEIKAAEKEGRKWQDEYLKEAFTEAEALIQRARDRKNMQKT
jgi:uncharacterized protein YabN with tetrapyrrole methylase and pyrophosphatase domain